MQNTSPSQLGHSATKRLPDFVGIGAQRCATSWLYECLTCHPQIFMPEKEIHFFDCEFERGVDWYLSHFSEATDSKLCGEFTPDYLSSPDAIERLSQVAPHAKLIVSLRHPLHRAYSAYRLFLAHGKTRAKSFQEAVHTVPYFIEGGMYGKQLSLLFQYFERDQVKVLFHDDVRKDPAFVIQDLYQWLGVDCSFEPPSLRKLYNISTAPSIQRALAFPALQKMLKHSFVGSLFRLLKHSGVATWLKRRTLNDHCNSDDVYSDPSLCAEFLADGELLSRCLNAPVPWIDELSQHINGHYAHASGHRR